jgi:hypothetical protein
MGEDITLPKVSYQLVVAALTIDTLRFTRVAPAALRKLAWAFITPESSTAIPTPLPSKPL